MFELLVSLSFTVDFFTIALYFTKPTIFGDSEDSKLVLLLNPVYSVLLLVVFCLLRVIVFVPYVWRYQKNDLLALSQRPYLWHTFNVVLVLFKAIAEIAKEGGGSHNLFVWLAICGSLLSVYCQSAALKQLISTALPERHLVLGLSLPHSSDRNDQLKGREHHMDLKAASPSTNSSSNRHVQKSSDPLLASRVSSYYTEGLDQHPHPHHSTSGDNSEFLQRLREQLDVAHNDWNMKIVKLKESIANFGTDNNSFSKPDTVVFEELLLLFATNCNNPHFGKATPPTSTAGRLGHSNNLVSSSNSSDLNTALNPNPSSATTTTTVVSDINTKETILRLFASHPKTLEFYIPQLIVYLLYGHAPTSAELREALLLICEQSAIFSHRMFFFIEAYCISGAGINSEGVAVLQQLLKSIEKAALPSAEQIASGCGKGESGTLKIPHDNDASFGPNAPNQFIAVGDHDVEAPPPSSSSSSASAAPCVYPLLLTRPLSLGTNAFTTTLLFWEQLSKLSRDLVPFSKQERTKELKERIPEIKLNFLPSSCIYAPVSNIHHRIWSIAAEECFAFSTKTRAPMFVCLEVVDYHCPHDVQKKNHEGKQGDSKSESVRKSWVHGLKRVMTEVGESLHLSPSLDHLGGSSAHRQSMQEDNDTDSDSDREHEEYEEQAAEEEKLTEKKKMKKIARSARRPLHRSMSTGSDMSSGSGSSSSHQESDAAGQWGVSSGSRRRSTATLAGENKRHQRAQDSAVKSQGKSSSSHAEEASAHDKTDSAAEYRQRVSVSNDSLDPGNCFSPASKYFGNQPFVVFKERWRDKERRLRAKSGVGNLPGFRLLPVIVKTNDDLRQEEIAAQLLFLMNQILIEGEVQCWLRPYGILAMSPDSGLIEAIPDTLSMDVLRRSVPNYSTLRNFFENFFGPEGSSAFTKARDNFVKSLAPYCIVCYLLNLKDRHNGNILLDRKGHVMHIDFGFIFGISPGGNIGFESAPFKLTAEFVELMDGPHSALFQRFRECCVKTFMELRKHHYRLALLLEMISVGNEHLPCFAGDPGRIIDEMRKRFVPHIHDHAAIGHVNMLINHSLDNWTTSCYDKYQKCFVGVF